LLRKTGNRGIGLEIVRQIALKKTCTVILTSRDIAEAQGALQDVRDSLSEKQSSSEVQYHQLDVTDSNSVQKLADWIAQQFGGLDVLINNAGYASHGSEINEKIARYTTGVNYFGVKNVTSKILPILRKNGRVITVSSTAGLLKKRYSNDKKARLLAPNITEEQIDELATEFINHVIKNTYSVNGWPSSTYMVSKVLVNAYTRYLTRIYSQDPRDLFFCVSLSRICKNENE